MLKLRPNCECCDVDLPGDSSDALICSFECTFCRACNDQHFHDQCPNCGGRLSPRPPRSGQALKNNPATTQRVLKKHQSCG